MILGFVVVLHYKDVGNSTSTGSISILASQFMCAQLFAGKQNNLALYFSEHSWIINSIVHCNHDQLISNGS